MNELVNHPPSHPKKNIPNNLLKSFEKLAKDLNIIKIGYYQLEPHEILISNFNLKYTSVIVFILEMNEKIIKLGPSKKAKQLNKDLYTEIREKVEILSKFLNENKFKTKIAYPNEKLINLPYLAQKTGLGEIGKNGLLITPELGPRIKIAAILTSIENLPFSKKHNEYNWISNYCNDCQECVKACKNDALIKKDLNKVKIQLDDKKCIGSEEGCSYCIEKCPFYMFSYSNIKKEFYQ